MVDLEATHREISNFHRQKRRRKKKKRNGKKRERREEKDEKKNTGVKTLRGCETEERGTSGRISRISLYTHAYTPRTHNTRIRTRYRASERERNRKEVKTECVMCVCVCKREWTQTRA